ncbi:MAG: GNAT family N-acetyltransferase [Synergistaceae bacterium]|jgi:ribosomal protein S18 acetylase RimI-like enzyme|nr:GNAT family N-acetyltransferase [Synergistaceae bacterium]
MIRTMTIADYDSVYALWIATPGMGLNDIDDSRDGIGKYLARNPKTCFVAESNGQIIGAILTGHDGRRGYISHTAVAISERKKGVGTALLDAAMCALENEGISKVNLVVFSKNEIGNEFWENRGFTLRSDLNYRNRTIKELKRFDT